MRRAWLALPLVGCAKLVSADFDVERRSDCVLVHPPDPPDVHGSAGAVTAIVAASLLDLGDGKDASGQPTRRTIGFDLDGLCTSAGAAPPCRPAAWTGAPFTPDGEGGRDNAIGAMLAGQADYFGALVLASSDITTEIQTGAVTPPFALRISGYTGLANDDQVEVTWLLPAAPTKMVAPKWDGSDTFALRAASGTTPVSWTDAHAYVSKFRLVAHLGNGVRLRLRNVPIPMNDTVLTANLTAIPGTTPHEWELRDGEISATTPDTAIFDATPGISKQLVGAPICRDDANYKSIKRFFCSFPDLALGATDGRCRGYSLGVAFEAKRVKLGDVVADPEEVLCPPGPKDPHGDDCASPP